MNIIDNLFVSRKKQDGSHNQMNPSSSSMSANLDLKGSSGALNDISKVSRIAAIVMFVDALIAFVMGRLNVMCEKAAASGKEILLQDFFQNSYPSIVFLVLLIAAVCGIAFCVALCKNRPSFRTTTILGLTAWGCFLLWDLAASFFWQTIGIEMRTIIYDGYLVLSIAFLVSLFAKMRHAKGSWIICLFAAMLVFVFLEINDIFSTNWMIEDLLFSFSRLFGFLALSGFYLVMSRLFLEGDKK